MPENARVSNYLQGIGTEGLDRSDVSFHLGSEDVPKFSREFVLSEFLTGDVQSVFLVDWDQDNLILPSKSRAGPQKLTISCSSFDELPPIGMRLKKFIWYYKCNFQPSGIWLLHLEDNSFFDWKFLFPKTHFSMVIQHHRHKSRAGCIFALPDYQIYPSRNIPRVAEGRPFRDREPVVFWRGTLSGSRLEDKGRVVTTRSIWRSNGTAEEKLRALRSFARLRLCETTRGNSLFDIGLHLGENSNEILESIPYLSQLVKDFKSPLEQTRFRYLLCLDGFDWPSNFYWAMLSGSVVFREVSEWETYGDNHFKPWIHYIPIQASLSDLEEKMTWCESNIEIAAEIARQARLTACAFFDKEAQNQRIKQMITAYGNFFTS